MIELAATVIITASSVLLFGYWFRYTCLLILSAKTTRDYAGEVATANQLGFLEVQSALHVAASAEFDRLQASLDRDYKLLTYLIHHAAGAQGEASLEVRMLQLNYRLAGIWYRTSRRLSPAAARRALEEMSQVVAHFANAMGEMTSGAATA
jgi:hypothetical protein